MHQRALWLVCRFTLPRHKRSRIVRPDSLSHHWAHRRPHKAADRRAIVRASCMNCDQDQEGRWHDGHLFWLCRSRSGSRSTTKSRIVSPCGQTGLSQTRSCCSRGVRRFHFLHWERKQSALIIWDTFDLSITQNWWGAPFVRSERDFRSPLWDFRGC